MELENNILTPDGTYYACLAKECAAAQVCVCVCERVCVSERESV